MKRRRPRALRRAGARWLAALACSASLACEARNSGTSPPAPPPASPAPAPPLATEQAIAPAAAPLDTRPTVGRVFEAPDDQGALALAGGAQLPLDTPVVVPRRASIELHFPSGASVRVVGPALIAAPPGPSGLLVQQGTVMVDQERAALHPGSGFWLATPRTRIELVQGARFALRAFADRSAELTAISGVLTLKTLEPAATRLPAGARAAVSTEGRVEIRPSSERLAQRSPPLHLQTEAARLGDLPERPAKRLVAAMGVQSAVERACEAVVTSVTREGELSARHRASVAQNDAQAMELQRELARQAAQTFNARRILGTHLSLLEADNLSQGTSPQSSPLIARARELLRELRP